MTMIQVETITRQDGSAIECVRDVEAVKRLVAHAERQANAIDQFTVEVAQQAEEIKRLREALDATNKFLGDEVVWLVGGDEGPAEPGDELSSKACSQIAANRAALAPNATGKHT